MLRKVRKKINKNLLFTYLTNFFSIISGMGSMYIITNYAGVKIYGILAIIGSTSGILTNIVSARTSEAIVKFVKEEMLKNNKENIKMILFLGLGIDFFIALLILILFYLLSNFIAENFIKDIHYKIEVWMYSFITFFIYLRGVPYGFFQTRGDFLLINKFIIIENILKLGGLIGGVFFLHALNLMDIIYIQLLSVFIGFVMFMSYFFQIYYQEYANIKLKFDKNILKKYWDFNLKTFTSSLLKAGNQKIDTLILSYFVDSKTIGVYEIIKKIVATPLGFLVSPFNLLYYSKLVEYFKTKNEIEIRKIILNITIIAIMISVIYIVFIFLFFKEILQVFNINYYTNLLIWFFIISFYYIPITWWSRAFSNATNPMYSIKANLIATFSFMIVSLIFTKLYSMNGYLLSIFLLKLILSIYWINLYKKEIYEFKKSNFKV